MRKNVYTKSLLRRPLHSLILAFLLLIATFSFVLRSVEFLTLRDQVFRLSEFYQAIGYLSGNHEFDDVNIGADFIEDSPYIELSDRRRVVQGVMEGVLNAAIVDSHGGGFEVRRGMWPGAEIPPEILDGIFYGELVEKLERAGGGWHLMLAVDEVLAGYPEHVVAHQSVLRMNVDLEDGAEFGITNLEIGERYLLRGMMTSRPMHIPNDPYWLAELEARIPSVGDENDILLMLPLYPEGLWYINVPHGETLDFTLPELTNISEEIMLLHHNHHAVQLRTTRDMMLMPIMLETTEMGFITQGRSIDQEDYEYANPVAVIHASFAHIRNLDVGDTLTVNVPRRHYVEHYHGIMMGGRGGTQTFSDVRAESIPQTEGMYELELEIIGIYNLFKGVGLGGDGLTTFSTQIYIPDSVLPDDVEIISDRWGSPVDQNYLPSTWYSFKLGSSRDEVAFIAENRLLLEEMGITLTFITSAQHFWESADVILQSIAFNGIVFSVVLVLVLLLVIFLFLRQRRKEFTVSRLLGYPTRRSIREVIFAATLFLVPIIIGAVFGWLFARRTIVNTLVIFEELHEGYEAVFSLSVYWLIGLIALVFILVLLMVLIGALRIVRRPVLELLQRKE